MPNKVFVIGLDGATLDLIRPWGAEGKLPHLAKIMKKGAFGELRSTIHPLTAPAWTSFMTGKNPGKHGIFDFISIAPNSYDVRYNNARSCRAPSLWKILSQTGKKVISINVPFTYPPEQVNGILVSGLDTPSTRGVFTYPPSLGEELKKHLGDYIIMAQYRQGRAGYLEEMFRMIEKRLATVEYVLGKHPWDFFMVVFSATDIVQHTFWKYMDPDHPQYVRQEAAEFGDAIFRVYERMDSVIGELLTNLDEDTTLMIMSDHGAGALKKAVFLNKWLEEEGLLQPVQSSSIIQSGGSFWKSLLGILKRRMPRGVKETAFRLFPELKEKFNSYLVASHIDWAQTKAFSFGVHGSIFINLAGRQPAGTVASGREYEVLRDEIIAKLSLLADPDTGELVIRRVHRREESIWLRIC